MEFRKFSQGHYMAEPFNGFELRQEKLLGAKPSRKVYYIYFEGENTFSHKDTLAEAKELAKLKASLLEAESAEAIPGDIPFAELPKPTKRRFYIKKASPVTSVSGRYWYPQTGETFGGLLGIHKEKERKRTFWKITHLPTGLALNGGMYIKKEQAKQITKGLLKEKELCGHLSSEDVKEVADAFKNWARSKDKTVNGALLTLVKTQ